MPAVAAETPLRPPPPPSKPTWRPCRIDGYLLTELLGPFIFGVAAFTAIMSASNVLFNLISLMVHFGLPLMVVLKVLALRLPEMIFYTFPMSMLLASLLAFGRLSGDSEIVALHAVGVSLQRIVAPFIAVAFLVSAATVALNEYVVPGAKWQAKNILYEAQHQRKFPIERENVFYDEFEDGRLVRFFYARRFDGQRMENALVQEFEEGKLARIIQADQAIWDGGSWRFLNGVMYQVAGNGEYKYVLRFAEQRVMLKSSLIALTAENREPMEMTVRELAAHIRRLEETGHGGRQINDLSVQWHQKLSIPFASLVFALVGASLGLRPHRASNSIGLGLSILIIFVYYIAMFLFMALGQSGHLAPILAAWFPNLMTGAIGLGLLIKAARR